MKTADISYKYCPKTQQQETLVCIHKDCVKAKKFELHCHKCLTLQHTKQNFDKSKTVNHLDDFMEIKKIFTDVETKFIERMLFIQGVRQKCIDFHKGKIQQIERFPFFDATTINDTLKLVDDEIQKFHQFLGVQEKRLNDGKSFVLDNFPLILDLYFQDEKQFQNQLTKALELVFKRVIEILSKKGLDIQQTNINQGKAIHMLEQKVSRLEKPVTLNKFISQALFFLIFTIINNQFQINLNSNGINLVEITNQIKQEIQLKQDSLRIYIQESLKSIDYSFQKQLIEQKQLIDEKYEDIKIENSSIKISLKALDLKQSSFKEQFQNLQEIIKNMEENFQEQVGKEKALEENTSKQLEEMTADIKSKVLLNRFFFRALHEFVGKIQLEFPIVVLQGFKLYLDEYLDYRLTYKRLYELSNQFSMTGIACFGAIRVSKPSHFQVVACDYVYEIFTETLARNKARKSRSSSSLYWYFVREISIGFAPNENVILQLADDFNQTDPYRFSLWLDHWGGRRVGNQTQLINSTEYKMAMYVIE